MAEMVNPYAELLKSWTEQMNKANQEFATEMQRQSELAMEAMRAGTPSGAAKPEITDEQIFASIKNNPALRKAVLGLMSGTPTAPP